MKFQILDLFPSHFQLNVGLKQSFKKSKFGALLSLLIISLSIFYFVYQAILYAGNKIDPKFKMQTILTEELLKIDLHEDLVGFRHEYKWNKSVEDLQKQNNKIYFIQLPMYIINTVDKNTENNFLNSIECTNPKLKGYTCIDFTKISDKTLDNNPPENIIHSLSISVIRCYETVFYGLPALNNCASKSEIEKIMEDAYSNFKVKAQMSQYNTTTQSIQNSYKTFTMKLQPAQYFYSHLSIIKSITTVTKGFFGEETSQFTLPYDYIKGDRFLDQAQIHLQATVSFEIEQQLQLIQIQYATFLEVIAICNSIFTLLCSIGIIGRFYSKEMINQDIKLMILQNIYQSDYINLLKKFKIFKSNIKNQSIKDDIDKQKNNSDQQDRKNFQTNFQNNNQKAIKKKQQQNQNNNSQNFDIESISKKNEDKKDHCKEISSKALQQPKDFTNLEKQQLQNQRDSIIQDENETNVQNIKHLNQEGFTKKDDLKNQLFNDLESQQLFSNDNLAQYKQISFQATNRNATTQRQLLLDSPQKTEITKSYQYNSKDQNIYSTPNSPGQSLAFDDQPDKIKELSLNEHQQQINTSKGSENLKIINNNSFEIKLQDILYKLIFTRRFQSKFKIDERLNQNLENQVQEKLNYLQIFKEIILLNKAVMLILSNDQFAAIRLTGCSSGFHSSPTIMQNQQISPEIQGQERFQTHLDQQFMIDESQEQQEHYINKFIERLMNNSEISEIDKRILSSLTSQ